jgi:hypothetical protein
MIALRVEWTAWLWARVACRLPLLVDRAGREWAQADGKSKMLPRVMSVALFTKKERCIFLFACGLADFRSCILVFLLLLW